MADQTPAHNRSVTRVQVEDVPATYTNDLELQVSVYDFTCRFGLLLEVSDDELTIRNVATIVMSPQHAKAMLNVLAKHVALYERDHGSIPAENPT